MKVLFSLQILVTLLAMTSCKQSASLDNGVMSSRTEAIEKVNPFLPNAFLVWRDGVDPDTRFPQEYYRFPLEYNSKKGPNKPDQFFFIPADTEFLSKDANRNRVVTGVHTAGIQVLGDVLTYPPKDGRTLSLRFLEPIMERPSGPFSQKIVKENTFKWAQESCDKAGGRLPSARELFDFCVGGQDVKKNANGYYVASPCRHRELKRGEDTDIILRGPFATRLEDTDLPLWSFTLDSTDMGAAWIFSGSFMTTMPRHLHGSVRCVVQT